MKTFKLLLFLIFVYLVQIVIASRFSFFGIRPDLLLIVTTLFAVSYGAEKGMLIGFLCGLLQDVFGATFYVHTISRAILGLLVGTFKESVFGREETVALTAVFVATVTNYILELCLLFFFFGKPLASPLVLFISLIISCLYNSLLAPLLYPIIKGTSRIFVVE